MSIVQPILNSSFFAGYLKVKKGKCQLLGCIPTLWGPHRLQPTRALHPWNTPGKNAKESSCFLLYRIFSTQELNPGILHHRQQNQPFLKGPVPFDWKLYLKTIIWFLRVFIDIRFVIAYKLLKCKEKRSLLPLLFCL